MSSTATEMVAVPMTDLVGSTAMADRVGPVVAEDLRTEHFGLLRGTLERTAGREVKNLGDGLMVVFSSASESLACAVQMQQVVEARNRRADEQLGVRIGVSLGEATVEDGDYFGEPVVESARLCAHATGGQIVVNALVRRLAGSRDGYSFNSLAAVELRGISEPVQAFELQWEPSLVTGIALPERLRELPATAYVGRVAERERMGELWGQAREGSLRLALMGGEAGVGKRRVSARRGCPRISRCRRTGRARPCSTGAVMRISACPISRGCRRSVTSFLRRRRRPCGLTSSGMAASWHG